MLLDIRTKGCLEERPGVVVKRVPRWVQVLALLLSSPVSLQAITYSL